jgi:hypothetical protein
MNCVQAMYMSIDLMLAELTPIYLLAKYQDLIVKLRLRQLGALARLTVAQAPPKERRRLEGRACLIQTFRYIE